MSYRDAAPFLSISPPAPEPGLLHVDTSPTILTHVDLDTPTKSPTAGRGRALSLAIPSLLTPGGASKDSPSPISPVQEVENRNVNAPLSRLRVEYRKLLRHVLQRLQERTKPASIFSSARSSTTQIPQSMNETSSLRGFVSVSSGLTDGAPYDSEEEELAPKVGKRGEDTDETCDRMTELREVLLGAELRGLHILSAGGIDEDPAVSRASGLQFGRRRKSTVGNSERPSAGSLNKDKADDGALLFRQCISVLSELISNDCRFTVSHFRPARPPNSLQSLCIDVARCLLVSQKGMASAKGVYEVGLAMIPAFESFPPSMRGRLCGFFEGVVRGCLSELKLVLGGATKWSSADPFEDRPAFAFNAPQISIQVEEPGNDPADARGPGGIKLWSTSTTAEKNVVSTYAPDHPLRVYYLSSLLSPLLASLLENIDMGIQSSDDEAYWVRRLLDTIVDLKPDVYQDVLEIVAYNTPRARAAALSVLATFWPKALGHNIVCLPLPMWRPAQDPRRLLRGVQEPSDHPYAHEFLPWRFPPPPRRMTGGSVTNLTAFAQQATQNLSITPCRACMKPVHDFGLLCPFCNSAVHFTCYDPPEGSTITEYTTSSGVQKLAVTRFSHILPPRRVIPEEPASVAGHAFRWVNLFTLSLCFVCQEPIWGVARQGLTCSGCQCCVHSECIQVPQTQNISFCQSKPLSEGTFSIDWSVLRRSFITYYRPIVLTEKELHNHSYETVSVMYCLLWLQLQLMNNGIAAGSLIINQADPTTRAAKANGVDEFELQYLVRLCDALLQNDRLQKSEAMLDYRRLEGTPLQQHSLLFQPSFLHYVTSLVKAPKEKQDPDLSGSFLRPEMLTSDPVDGESQPYELTELAYAHDVLVQDLLVDLDFVVRHMLQFLHQLGLLERVDLAGNLFDGSMPARQICMFPLPLGIDLSSNVESLFTAVEACLSDVDLMVNEAGFLLLKRCSPNGLASAYAIDRLVRVVLQWIMREDRSLLTVARDYVSQKKLVPGIRSALDTQPWPTTTAMKSPAIPQGGTMTGGNEYIAFRHALLDKYAIPWLLRAHNLDTAAYMKTLHEHCLATAAEETESVRLTEALFPTKDSTEPAPKIDISFADATLRSFLKLCQASVVFTAFDELFMFWLDEISNHGTDSPMVVRTLPRLFQTDSEAARRTTMAGDIAIDQNISLSDLIDPWRSVTSIASEGIEGVARSLRWVLVLAQSGVTIPEMTFRQIAGFARDFQAPLDVQLNLVHAIFASIWVRSLGRQDLAALIETLLERNEESLIASIKHTPTLPVEALFIRLSLAGLLALYGVDREKIVDSGLVQRREHEVLTSRRRVGARLFGATEHLNVSEAFVTMLLHLSRLGTETTASYVMNFLELLLTEATLLSRADLDLFIDINSDPMCRIVWHTFTWNTAHMPDLRVKCLIRLLIVNTKPFEALLDEMFDLNQPWHSRLDSAGTLFSLILELNNNESALLGSNSRRRLSGLYFRFFKLLWDDDQEVVRSAVETMSETLLSSHKDFIQSCWDDYIENCDESEKEQFVRFLLRLHPYLPTWSLISTRVIVDALANDRTIYEDPTSIYDNIIDSPDMSEAVSSPRLQAMLVSLALNLVAHGVVIQALDLLKVKVFLARQLGFSKAVLRIAGDGTCHVAPGPVSVPEPPEQGLACLAATKRVLDASTKISVSPSILGVNLPPDAAVPCLIGAPLVDLVLIVLRATQDLATMSHLVLRSWLESLIIIILKHDMRSPVLKHLDTDLKTAVARTTEILTSNAPYDNRQLALTVNQCYVKKFGGEGGAILSRQINAVSDMLAALDFNSEDILVAQGKAFLTSTFLRFPNSGLFVMLLKNGSASENLIKALSETLKDCSKDGVDGQQFALKDIMERAFYRTSHSEFNSTIANLYLYVDKVYTKDWPVELITEMGFCLSNISRHTAEWASEDFSGDAPILIAAALAERDAGNSRELMIHSELYLRWALLRFDIQTSTLQRLLKAAELVAAQPQKGPGPIKNEPYLAVAIIDSLRDTMMAKPRPTLVTVLSMLETARTISLEGPRLTFSVPDRLAADCLTYMQSFHTTGATATIGSLGTASYDLAFAVCVEASKIFLLGLSGQREALRTAFGAGAGQAMAARAGQVLRMWAFLALAALSLPTEPAELRNESCKSLAQHLMDYHFTFATLMNQLLETIRDERNNSNDLSYAHASLVLWLLLARSLDAGGVQEASLWHGVWPSFERLIIKAHGLEGGPMLMAAQQISDIFMDLVMFLLRSHSPLAMKYSATFSGLLSAMKEVNQRAQSKITKCMQALSSPPRHASRQELLFEAQSALLANEKVTSAYMSEYLRNNYVRNARAGRPV